jgi:hypothetical protein
MSTQVKVTSIDTLDTFRANLIVFMSKARRAVDDVSDEVRRTRMWLQHDQRMFWENEVRKRAKKLEQAEAELFSAKLSGLKDSITMYQIAVRRAKEALAHAEGKVRAVKMWNRNYDSAADPLTKRLESMREILDYDMPNAVTFLVQSIRTLEAYAETVPTAPAPPPAVEGGEAGAKPTEEAPQ